MIKFHLVMYKIIKVSNNYNCNIFNHPYLLLRIIKLIDKSQPHVKYFEEKEWSEIIPTTLISYHIISFKRKVLNKIRSIIGVNYRIKNNIMFLSLVQNCIKIRFYNQRLRTKYKSSCRVAGYFRGDYLPSR
jgi:hypothetical protein